MGAVAMKNINMLNIMQIPKAALLILRDWKYFSLFFIAWVIMFGVMFYIPVKVIPGNNISFQALLFGPMGYLFLAVTSFLSSLIIAMQIKIFKQRKTLGVVVGNTTLGSTGLFSGILSSIFGSATCSLCVGALFGFLGANSVLFLVNNKAYVVIGSFSLLLLSLYFSSKRFNTACEVCRIHDK